MSWSPCRSRTRERRAGTASARLTYLAVGEHTSGSIARVACRSIVQHQIDRDQPSAPALRDPRDPLVPVERLVDPVWWSCSWSYSGACYSLGAAGRSGGCGAFARRHCLPAYERLTAVGVERVGEGERCREEEERGEHSPAKRRCHPTALETERRRRNERERRKALKVKKGEVGARGGSV